MIFQFSDSIVSQIDSVERSITAHEILFSIINDSSFQQNEIDSIRKLIPAVAEWRIIEHCSVLTRLYSIFEGFVDASLQSLISIFNSFARYSELDDKFKRHYRDCIGAILQKLDNRRYSSLSIKQVINDYLSALSDDDNYLLLPDALLRRDQNLKPNILYQLFNDLGINDVQRWLTNHKLILEYIDNYRESSSKFESELTTFVEYRNDSSHGTPSEILGSEVLRIYCEFIKVVCIVLEEALNHWLLTKYVNGKKRKPIGISIKSYSDNVSIARLDNCKISEHDKLIVYGTLHCFRTQILEMKIDDRSTNQLVLTAPTEVGLRTDKKIHEKSELFLT